MRLRCTKTYSRQLKHGKLDFDVRDVHKPSADVNSKKTRETDVQNETVIAFLDKYEYFLQR